MEAPIRYVQGAEVADAVRRDRLAGVEVESGLVIAVADPGADEVRALLERHHAFAREVTPPEGVHALEPDGLHDPAITLFDARIGGDLLGIAALRRLDDDHGEVKSMHTTDAARRRGVGRALLEHIVSVARKRGYLRLGLETGAMDAFAPARSLYASAGFEQCAPFGDYRESPTSVCMTLELGQG